MLERWIYKGEKVSEGIIITETTSGLEICKAEREIVPPTLTAKISLSVANNTCYKYIDLLPLAVNLDGVLVCFSDSYRIYREKPIFVNLYSVISESQKKQLEELRANQVTLGLKGTAIFYCDNRRIRKNLGKLPLSIKIED